MRPAHRDDDGQAACRAAAIGARRGSLVVHFPDDSSTVAGPSVGWTSAVETHHLFGLLNAGGVGTIGAASGSVTASGGARAALASHLLVEGGGELFGIAGSAASEARRRRSARRALVAPLARGGAWARATRPTRGARPDRCQGSPSKEACGGTCLGHASARRCSISMRTRSSSSVRCAIGCIGTVRVHYTEGALGAHVEGDARRRSTCSAACAAIRTRTHLYDPMLVATAAFWIGETRAWTVSVSQAAARLRARRRRGELGGGRHALLRAEPCAEPRGARASGACS